MVRHHGNCGSRPLTIVTLWIHDMAIMVIMRSGDDTFM